MFGQDISGVKFVELLIPYDVAEQRLMEDILVTVFEDDDLQREACLSLMPSEASVRGRPVELQYKWIPAPSSKGSIVMVVMTDISEKREMEQHLEQERKVMRMVVKAIKHFRDFKELVAEYEYFANKGRYALFEAETSLLEKCSELSLLVHTFKGNFAQFDFIHLPERLHELETEMSSWKQKLIDAPAEKDLSDSLGAWFGRIDLQGWLEEDLRILHDHFGDRFNVEDKRILIEPERLEQLERRIMELLPGPEAEILAAELHKLQYCPFSELLSMYPAYLEQLARQTGKEIHPFGMESEDFLVDPAVYGDFSRSLIHVFRNMIDHGIEMPEERVSLGKDPRGRVGCRIYGREKEIELQLFNDGRPIDLSVIRNRMLEKEMATAEQFDTMSAGEQRMFIVQEGFTSKRIVTQLSGRGFGLSAVYKALQELQGKIRIDSSAEEGTTFTFILPRC